MAKPSFRQLISGTQPVLVDFYADWCGPCQTLAPVVDQVAKEMAGRLKVVKVNVDRNQAAAQQYQVRSIPTLVVFKQGRPVWRKAGLMTARDLQHQLQQVLG